MSVSEDKILEALEERQPLKIDELAEKTKMSKRMLWAHLRNLCDKGKVKKRVSLYDTRRVLYLIDETDLK